MPKSFFQKILLAVDGSETSLQAEELSVMFAKKFQSKVTAVHAVPEQLLDLGAKTPTDIPKAVLSEVSEWFVTKGEDVLKNTQALFQEEGVKIEARLAHGDPAENIITLAAKEKFDLIIAGTRGETEAELYSLGSTAEKISRHAECSVLVVKEKSSISKILVGFDGSEKAQIGLKHAVHLAQKLDAEITVVNVQERRLFEPKPAIAQKLGKRILLQAAAELKGVDARQRLEFGNPAEGIIELANKENFDLIVVGSRGLSRAKRFLLGSVSDDVAHHSRCSVLIAR
ncbi:MAG TPA: universal stress protein [Candidatus Bathyarchaeia archaeon]|nr:universal stress protein [Candidatus Bathyarchaeia archaeon]